MSTSDGCRKLHTALIMALALCLSGCASSPNLVEAERYILEGDRQWAESVASGDAAVLERILADDFVGTDPHGNLYDKAQMIKNTRELPKYYASNKIGKVTVRFFGSTAVAQGEESWVKHSGEPLRGRFVWTDTWVFRNGRWQIVAAQDVIAKER